MRPRTFLLGQNGVASRLETLKEIGFYQSDSLTEIVGVPTDSVSLAIYGFCTHCIVVNSRGVLGFQVLKRALSSLRSVRFLVSIFHYDKIKREPRKPIYNLIRITLRIKIVSYSCQTTEFQRCLTYIFKSQVRSHANKKRNAGFLSLESFL